jgi:PleD family two-component response regulator
VGLKILIADDDFFSYKLLQKMLESAGHTVLIAEDGVKAWELIQQHEIRMVITDWMMPNMDGLQLCRTIRENNTPGYVFIILLTARDSKDDIITGLESGADDYLSKPFNRGELMARLKSGLRILELEKSLQQAKKEIEQLAVTDPLTQCFNKRYLNENLPAEIKRSRRYGHPLSVIMSDIDHFKKVNDTYGHLAGDDVLKKFATHVKGSVRQNLDWVVRYGDLTGSLPRQHRNG